MMLTVELPPGDLRQPDATSCGPSCVVVARMLTDGEYAAEVAARGFAAEVRATHRRLTGTRDPAGRLQVPWPAALGTPPWAIARDLEADGTRRRVRIVRLHRSPAFERIRVLAAGGALVAVYVGSRLLPRHVLLVVGTDGADLVVYDPVIGGTRSITRTAFVAARLAVDGWDVPWFAVTPR